LARPKNLERPAKTLTISARRLAFYRHTPEDNQIESRSK
jgi:hypothetical protein